MGTLKKIIIIFFSYTACKPIPVMIFGVLIARKSYSLQKYFCVLMIVIGVGVFIYKNDHESHAKDYLNWGNILIGISLLTDGIMGASEDLMRKNSKPSAINFMFYLNAWSSLFLSVMLLANNEGLEFIKFTIRHNEVLLYLGCVLVTGSFGQFFLSSTLTNFGALPLSIVTTLRKFFTILLSCFLYNNTLSLQQWIATGIIFGALTLDVILRGTKFLNPKELNLEKNVKSDDSKIKEVQVIKTIA
jgi:UDP-galactose transporter B1